MALLGRRLAVALPDTFLEEKSDLRGKTTKLGTVARACAIYGVDEIQVFNDPGRRGEPQLIEKVLAYLETPQYLRKRLFPLDESLRFAGVLPPLRIPSHRRRAGMREVKVGEVREGVVEADGTVDVGLEVKPRLRGAGTPGRRVTSKVLSIRPFEVAGVGSDEVGEYWGYGVSLCSLSDVFSAGSGVVIATSRLGDKISARKGGLREDLSASKAAKLVFGAPSRGLFEMVPGLRDRADYVLNLYAEQHTETVRTEEALFAGLGLLDVLLSEKA